MMNQPEIFNVLRRWRRVLDEYQEKDAKIRYRHIFKNWLLVRVFIFIRNKFERSDHGSFFVQN